MKVENRKLKLDDKKNPKIYVKYPDRSEKVLPSEIRGQEKSSRKIDKTEYN